jgi:hypothetical protein
VYFIKYIVFVDFINEYMLLPSNEGSFFIAKITIKKH